MTLSKIKESIAADREELFQLLIVATVVLFFSILIYQTKSCPQCTVNNDVLGGLYTGYKLLHGATLYVDWIELNPPSIFLFFLFSTAFGEAIRVPWLGSFYFFLMILVLYGLAEIRVAFKGDGREKAFQLAYLASIAGASYGGFFDFGEREHIFMVLFFPYWISRILSENKRNTTGRPLLFLIGFAGMMKPGFALMILVVELWAYFKNLPTGRKIWPYLIFGSLAPFLFLALFSWQSLIAFFGEVVPSYRFYDHGDVVKSWETLRNRLEMMPALIPISIITVLVCWFYRRLLWHKSLWRTWTILVLISIISLIQQEKYWPYHLIPIFALSVFLVTHVFFSKMEPWRRGGRINIAAFAMVWLIMVFQVKASWQPSVYYSMTSRFLPLLGNEKKVMLLNYRYGVMGSAYFSGVNVVGPWAHLYTLSGIEKLPPGEVKTRARQRLGSQIRTVIEREKPRLLIVEKRPRGDAPALHRALTEGLHLLPRQDYQFLEEREIDRCCPGQGEFFVYQRVPGK